ncbi:MAG: hypothetical protein ACRC1R_07080 [Cetobacterium sp.]|uniref:hypothetical protein n=1 Tax=Cetobacterium sp. TaxID=2071632 RepID=UPI003F40010A
MKKLSIVLGALVAVSSLAQAKETVVAPVIVEETVREVVIIKEAPKPWLRLKSIGQEIEVENNSGSSNIGESVYFANMVNLETDNWDFGLQAGRFWNVDTKEGMKKTNTRMQLDAWRNFKAESFKYSLGGRYRAQKDLDRFYLRGKYSTNTGMFAGWVDLFYNSTTGSSDSYVVEAMPANVKFGPLTVGYFISQHEGVGGNKESITEQQIRSYLDLYKGEKLTLKLENRLTIKKSGDASNGKTNKFTYDAEGNVTGVKRGGEYGFGNRNRTYLKAAYKVTPAFEVYGHYAYEFQKSKDFGRETYYGNFVAGWNYKF